MSEPRTALVTGGSRGIGAAVATQLAADGFRVFATATTSTAAASIGSWPEDPIHGLVLRLEDPESIAAALKQVNALASPVSALVANAGMTRDNLLMRMSAEEWNHVLDVNLRSLHALCKPVVRGMLRHRWGRVVSLGSVVGRMGSPGQANYCAAKAAIEGFTRSLSMEVGSRGITVNCVAPGFIETDMTKSLGERGDKILAQIPMGRIGRPEEVADLVSFLASEKAGYISGQTIHVNGGLFPA